jgi:KDO2-lipid IV(A) lauroyltransferase
MATETAQTANPQSEQKERTQTEGFGRVQTQRWQRFILKIARQQAKRLQAMPRTRALKFGERLGSFAFWACKRFSPRPIHYALRNLRLTEFPSPNATQTEREAFIRQVFIHFSKGAVDFLRGPVITPDALDTLVKSDGMEHAHAAHAKGKGVIFVTAHFGNWEMLARYLSHHDFPLTVVAREPENPEFGAYVEELRNNGGLDVLYRGSSARALVRVLKANRAIGILPDQNSGDIFVPFFGVPAGTAVGPASLALRTGATLIPAYCVREPDDTYRLLLSPPLDTTPTGDHEADVRRVTEAVNNSLESIVRRYPDQWLWVHNRWKSAFEEGNLPRAWPDGKNEAVWARWEGR